MKEFLKGYVLGIVLALLLIATCVQGYAIWILDERAEALENRIRVLYWTNKEMVSIQKGQLEVQRRAMEQASTDDGE